MSIEYRSLQDKWVKCISNSGTIRAVAITATDISNKLASRHKTTEVGSKALAEGIIAGLLLSSYCKNDEKVNLNIQATGWCHQAIIDANSTAEVRGYVIERSPAEIEIARNIGPWGIGLLSVLRTKHDEAKPYIGTVPLLTGHIAKDLTFYWLQSEQVQSAVGIEVLVEHGAVVFAQGFLIQAMPGATDNDIRFIENHLKKLHELGTDSAQRKSPKHLLSYLFQNQPFSIIEEKNLAVKCPCSMERVKRSIALVGTEELQAMIQDGKNTEITCDFCSEQYIFTPLMLEGLLQNGGA